MAAQSPTLQTSSKNVTLFGIFIERLSVALSGDLAVVIQVGVVGSTRSGRKSSSSSSSSTSSKPTKETRAANQHLCKSTNYGIVTTQLRYCHYTIRD